MKYVYSAIFSPEPEGGYSVVFPDIPYGATQGDTIAECIDMAQDFLCLALYDMENDKKPIPTASRIKDVKSRNDDIVTLISVDTTTYRRYFENKAVKKTLTLPTWLNQKAEDANINFSQTLKDALVDKLAK